MDPVLVIALVAVAVAGYLLGRARGAAAARREFASPNADLRLPPPEMPPVLPAGAGLDGAARARISQALASRNKIEAIKLYRQATGLGLKESKDAIDLWERFGPPEAFEEDGQWPQLPQA